MREPIPGGREKEGRRKGRREGERGGGRDSKVGRRETG